MKEKRRACVVGGGFGGLTTAALLARSGWKVTLVEKNSELGGRARAWHEKGFVFDMGPSWYLMPEVFEQFFAYFGEKRENFYALNRLDPYYRVFWDDGSVDITPDIEKTRATFATFEPNGDEKLTRYMAGAKYKYDIAMKEFLYRDYKNVFQFLNKRILLEGTKMNIFSGLDSFVRRYFTSDRAAQILEYAMVFLGSSPKNAPALYSIMSHVDLDLGVFFPQGGMTSVVSGLSRLAESLGVEIRTSSPVTRLAVTGGRVDAVKTENDTIPCDLAVVNADYAFAESRLLPPEYRTYSEKYWNKRTWAPSMFILYLGLSKKLAKTVHHNLYFSTPWDDHFDTIFKNPAWPENPSYYVSCASYDDPTVAPEGHENVFFLVPVAPGLEDTDEIREKYAEKILDHFERLTGETIRDSIIIRRVYSHRDFAADYNAFKGSALGLAHTLNQTAVFRPGHRSKRVGNLYYSGQYTHPGVGVPMTFIASQVVSNLIDKDQR